MAGLAGRADKGAEPAHDIDPAFIDKDGHGVAYGVPGEPGLLHKRDLAGQLGPGRVGAVIDTRPQIVRKLYMLGNVGAIELHE